MKFAKYIPLIFILVAGLISCKKDFLSVGDQSVIIRQDYVVNLKTAGDYLNGVYTNVCSGLYQGYNQIYPDLVADNIKPKVGSTTLSSQYNWAQVTDVSGANMNNMWSSAYKVIRSCSFVIEKAEAFRSEDPAKADNLKAQAYALRALSHFLLVNVFAQPYSFTADASHPGIPYVTTSDWTLPMIRQSVADVYNGIIGDLDMAIPLFSAGTTSTLVMNRNAAKALLARTCLFKGDYQMAKNLAREVGNAVPIMTGSNYPSKLFTLQETEALFQLAPVAISTGIAYSTDYQGRYFFSGTSTSFLATSDIAGLIMQDPLDVRKSWIKSGGAGKDTIVKFPVNVVTSPAFSPTSLSYYITVIRSSEMYLTAAEAYAQLHLEDSARYYVNAIKKRSNPLSVSVTATGTALLDSIYIERRKELAFEGFRMFDLLRWKKEVKRTDALSSGVQQLPYPSNKAIAPLPLVDVDAAGLEQNLGY